MPPEDPATGQRAFLPSVRCIPVRGHRRPFLHGTVWAFRPTVVAVGPTTEQHLRVVLSLLPLVDGELSDYWGTDFAYSSPKL